MEFVLAEWQSVSEHRYFQHHGEMLMSVHEFCFGSEEGNFRVDCRPHILYVAVSADYQFDLFKVLHYVW